MAYGDKRKRAMDAASVARNDRLETALDEMASVERESMEAWLRTFLAELHMDAPDIEIAIAEFHQFASHTATDEIDEP